MCSCHVYALKLETAFRKGTCCPFSADEFEADFQGTLALGLSRLSAENLIENQKSTHGWKNMLFAAKSYEKL